jgi:2-(1,2-epoxy-1,2-dihydrophenyl)acetyl-CoA isomerase
MGVTFYLPRALGPRRAALWLLRARRVEVTEAASIGLVDEVVAAAELRARARSVAAAFASGDPGAVAFVLNRDAEVIALEAALAEEREATVAAKQTSFHREAVERFFAKTGSS